MRRYVQLACVLSALSFGTLAHADDAAMAEAQARFKEGLDLADGAKYEEARLKFLQAFAVLKAPAVLFNLAAAEQKTGHDVEAIEHYRAFLKTGATDTRITDAMRDKAKQNIADLLKKVGQVDVDAPDGAKITVDGRPIDELANAKEPVPVTPGKHKIEAAFNGRIKSITIDCKLGEIVKAKIDFEPTTGDQPPPTGSDAERSTAGYAVPIGLGVLGLTGVIMGGVFASGSQSAKDESEALRRATPGLCSDPASAACRAYDDKRDSAESQATLSYVGYIVGGLLVAGGVGLFVFWPKSGKTSQAQGMAFTPMLGPQVGGGSLKLTF